MADGTESERHGFGVLDWFDNSFATRFLRLLAPYAIVVAAIPFLIDLDFKSTEREAQAWELVTTQATGNSGKIAALEYLNSDHPLAIPNPRRWNIPVGPIKIAGEQGIPARWILLKNYGPWKQRTPLVGIDLSQKKDPGTGKWLGAPTYLEGINLDNAEIARANFTAATMNDAVLSNMRAYRAIFVNANLEGATFANSRLVNVDFTNARLKDVDFSAAVLKGATFLGADLRGAKLATATELIQAQIDGTCTDENTTLPPGVRPAGLGACATTERGTLIRGEDGLPTRLK